jgi:hypothetical protein
MSGQLHALTALSLGKEPRYPLHRRLGGGSRAGLDAVEKILDPYQDSNCKFSVLQLVAILYDCYNLDASRSSIKNTRRRIHQLPCLAKRCERNLFR